MSVSVEQPALQAPTTLGAYLRRRREAAGLTARDVAIMSTENPQRIDALAAELEELEAADGTPNQLLLMLHGLRQIFTFDVRVAMSLAERDPANPDLPAPQLCRICACSWMAPCVGEHGDSCAWAEADLCTCCESEQ